MDLFGIRFAMMSSTVMAAASSSSAALSSTQFRMSYTPSAIEISLRRAEDTVWSREMKYASEFVSRRRRRRNRARRLRRGDEMISPFDRRRELQDGAHSDEEFAYGDDDDDDGASSYASTTTTCLSPLQKWFVYHIESMGVDAWEDMNEYNITSLAYYYKHHVSGDDGTNEYFGKDGERTDRMIQNHDALAKFWSTAERREGSTTASSGASSNDVVLLGMHGVDLADDARLLATLQQMHRMDYGAANFLLEKIRHIIESLPGMYDNPLLTANAIAIQSVDPFDGRSERDSIIVGDGIYEFLEWLGLGDDGVAYIHSHEYAHHLQYDLGIGYYGSTTSAEAADDSTAVETRWWEMMADALGSYFNAHSAGGRMDDDALLNVHRAAFSLGDCEDTIGSHHGLPRQRECASNYGADLALVSYYNDGYVMPPSVLRDLFDEKYERMVRLDGEQCTAVVDESVLDVEIYGDVRDSEIDYSSYFDGYDYGIELSHSFVDEMDKPPPILQDENGTIITKEETGFWGGNLQWISEPTSAVGHSDIRFTFLAPTLAYILLR